MRSNSNLFCPISDQVKGTKVAESVAMAFDDTVSIFMSSPQHSGNDDQIHFP